MKNATDTDNRTETPEELIEHISSLMSEAEAMLVGPAAGVASEKFGKIQDRFHEIQSRVSSLYGDARRKVTAGAKATDETIRSHPYESLAIALGIGVLLGALIRRGSSD
jgi:ElaB/YqjD/DUF883 family membrane-anchored ribosome-binding protein